MDASRLTFAFAILIGAYGLGRFVFTSVSRAGDGMAALFVPPDQALGWPRGVQEGDEPWGWHSGLPALDVIEAGPPLVPDPGRPGSDPGVIAATPPGRHSRYVAVPRKVAPIRFRTLPRRVVD